jgi:hypothetical protein
VNTPMMKCGHAANSVDGRTGKPACVICAGIHPGAYIVDDAPPDLSKRTARCAYYGGNGGRNNEGPCRGGSCQCEKPSSPDLAFFEHCPGKEHDQFYCGCHGWD